MLVVYNRCGNGQFGVGRSCLGCLRTVNLQFVRIVARTSLAIWRRCSSCVRVKVNRHSSIVFFLIVRALLVIVRSWQGRVFVVRVVVVGEQFRVSLIYLAIVGAIIAISVFVPFALDVVLRVHDAAHHAHRFATQIHKVKHSSGNGHNPCTHGPQVVGEHMLDVVAVPAAQSETEVVNKFARQPIGDKRQEHRAPNHDDGKVEEPLPQAHTIGPHKLNPHKQGEYGYEQ